MGMASPTLINPPTTFTQKTLTPIRSKLLNTPTTTTIASTRRRQFISLAPALILLLPATIPPAYAASSDEEYVKETEEVISKVRNTVNMAKSDPNIEAAVADLKQASNSWVAKYRREKSLLARASFRDIYSALNAVSGHYVSFGPTAPIPAKRKQRILEEMDTAEKALVRGR